MFLSLCKKQRNGVLEWFFQRATNCLIVLYGLVMASHFLSESAADYESTVKFFSEGWVILFSALVLVFACLNSILAGWQIAGDYLNKDKNLNKLFMSACIAVTVVYLLFGLFILG